MHCCLAALGYFAPRFTILLVVIFSDYIGRAYDGFLVPLLGFFFLPLTTLAYAWAMNSYGSLSEWGLAVVVFALLVDLGIIGGGAKKRRCKDEDD